MADKISDDGLLKIKPSFVCPEFPVDVFETSIGWFGLQHRNTTIQRIKFGFSSRKDVLTAFGVEGDCGNGVAVSGMHWRDVIRRYAAGELVSFSHLEIETAWMTPFQKNVIGMCRQIPIGVTVSYGQLATKVGCPGAARAVGSVMRTNRFPIVVPCHRVVRSNGLGGFSASDGVKTKRMLLELENAIDSNCETYPLFD